MMDNKLNRAAMAEKNTIESLISTSGEEEWEGLPLFYEGKIIKRISKEEIQGWNQGRLPQPFQKIESHTRRAKRTIIQGKQPQPSESFEKDSLSPPPSLRTIKTKLKHYDNNQNLFQAFHTLKELPQSAEQFTFPKVRGREEPKEDFVKGIKFANFAPTPKKATNTLKPLFKAFCEQNSKTEGVRCRSVSERVKNAYKRPNLTEKQVSLISYPMDVQVLEENQLPLHNKLHSYMRKYQIDIFQL